MHDQWTVATAKAKLSEVIDRAESEGAQFISRNGKPAAVIVSAEEWARRVENKGTIVEFFMNSPLRGSRVKVGRMKGGMRKADL
jgi:prevent-host-death family protein